MKFLHMADLHIGKVLNGIPLMEDQRLLLRQAAALAEQNGVDAVILAGDIYQRLAPQAEAMTLFNSFLSDLHARNIPVIAISGNHDSDERVAYLNDLVSAMGIHLSAPFHGIPDSVILNDAYGEVEFHLLPFLRASAVRKYYPGEKLVSAEDAMSCVIAHTPLDKSRRHVMIAHQFITGSVTCDSEERIVGGLDAIAAEVFAPFDYTALGHIHTPQQFLEGKVRYCGSLMKYSFSEAGQKKGLLLVELGEKGEVHTEHLPLDIPHDMRELRGGMEELTKMPPSDDYLRVTVTDENVPPDAQITLRQIFRNMMVFRIENSKTDLEMEVVHDNDIESKSLTELFCEFYADRNNGVTPAEKQMKLLGEILTEMEVETK